MFSLYMNWVIVLGKFLKNDPKMKLIPQLPPS